MACKTRDSALMLFAIAESFNSVFTVCPLSFLQLVISMKMNELLQENWQKLLELQHMLSGIDNIILADRVCAVCLKYLTCQIRSKFG